nr:uncharacterized protein LOC116650044 [Drosophila virilis]
MAHGPSGRIIFLSWIAWITGRRRYRNAGWSPLRAAELLSTQSRRSFQVKHIIRQAVVEHHVEASWIGASGSASQTPYNLQVSWLKRSQKRIMSASQCWMA